MGYGTVGAAVLVALASAHSAGVRINMTPSMPQGLWHVAQTQAPLWRGEIVTICPPDIAVVRLGASRGYIPVGDCPGGYEPLVKPIAATAGDTVAIALTGVQVNGEEMSNTVPLREDSAGRPLHPLPPGTYRVASAEIWVLSGHDPRSFDSRYFGPVPVANVVGVAQPIWVLR